MGGLLLAGLGRGVSQAADTFGSAMNKSIEGDIKRQEKIADRSWQEEADERKAMVLESIRKEDRANALTDQGTARTNALTDQGTAQTNAIAAEGRGLINRSIERGEEHTYNVARDQLKADQDKALAKEKARVDSKIETDNDPGKEYRNEKIKEKVKELNFWKAKKVNQMKADGEQITAEITRVTGELDALTSSGGNTYSIREETDADGNIKKVRETKGKGAMPGNNMTPAGLPPGARQIGTSGGKPVYQTPDGKRFIGE